MQKVNRPGDYGYVRTDGSSNTSFNIPPTKTHQVSVVQLQNGTIRIKCKKDRCKFSAGPFSTLAEAESSAALHLIKQVPLPK